MLTSLRGKLILIFVVLTVSIVIISSGFARYKQRQFALARASENAIVDLQMITADIQSVLRWIMRDLLVLRDLPNLQQAINTNSPEQYSTNLKIVEQEFLTLAAHHRIFQQIRFIDRYGKEIIRVNTRDDRTWLTPVEKLQDKSNRYYFQAASKLEPGQVYVSPMDLNVEQGEIERPLMPVIRYATPVVDRNGIEQGVLVLNVFGTTFLQLLHGQQGKSRHGQQFFLLNSDGYFLYHPDYAKTFGFMLGTEETLARHEPELAATILQGKNRVIIQKSSETGKKTLFAFQRIQPTSSITTPSSGKTSIQSNPRNDFPDDSYWTLLTAVDDVDLLVGFSEYVQSFLPFTLILLTISIGVAVAVAWNLSRPVVSLARATRQIQKGDFSARAQVYTSDDMGKFGNQFNKMAQKLEKTINSLQLSEAKYRQIFENSKDCFFVTDTKCTLIDINQAGRTLLGLDKDTPLIEQQLSLNCCISSPDQENDKPILQQAIRSRGYVKDFETTLQRPDNSIRYCIMTASARYDEQGTLLGFEGILRDITEKKQRRQAKRSFRKQLQEEIVLAEERERRHIGQVLHEELAQTLALVNMKLRETEQQVDQFQVSGVDGGPNISNRLSETRELISLMIGQIRTMIFDLFPTVLDDRGLVAAMHWYGEHYSKRTGINVTVYGMSGSLGLAESQKIYLFRSFKELLHNAWKHAETKEIVATVKKKDDHVRLTVDDEGKGFDPEEERNKPPSQELKGIGLISIKQWITAMEGTISIESAADKGTRVAISIPLAAPLSVTQHKPEKTT